jgi:hypothetical protein
MLHPNFLWLALPIAIGGGSLFGLWEGWLWKGTGPVGVSVGNYWLALGVIMFLFLLCAAHGFIKAIALLPVEIAAQDFLSNVAQGMMFTHRLWYFGYFGHGWWQDILFDQRFTIPFGYVLGLVGSVVAFYAVLQWEESIGSGSPRAASAEEA